MAGFVRTSNDLIDSGALDRLSLCATRVYRRMERLADRSGRCFPGLGKLAAWVGFCVRSVSTAIRELVTAGLVTRCRRGGRGRATVYQLARTAPSTAKPACEDLPLFSHLSQAKPMSRGSSSQASALPTTQPQPVTQKQQQGADVVAFERTGEQTAAVKAILQRTDAPRERAEAMARDYPLAVIQHKLTLLATAKRVRSTGAWLSAALAADYRSPAVLTRLSPEAAEQRRQREARRQEAKRQEDAKLLSEAAAAGPIADWAKRVRESLWPRRSPAPKPSGVLCSMFHRTSDEFSPPPADFVKCSEVGRA